MRKNPFKEIYKNKKERNISKFVYANHNIISSFLLTQISFSAFELIRPSAAFATPYAAGANASATLNNATAVGADAEAMEKGTAIGSSATASGYGATAVGSNAEASSIYSNAFGSNSTASGYYSTASGYASTASGSSIALGICQLWNYSTASGYLQQLLDWCNCDRCECICFGTIQLH